MLAFVTRLEEAPKTVVGDCSLTDLGAWAITTRRIGYRSFFQPLVFPRTRPSSSLTSLVNFSPLVGFVWHQSHTHTTWVSHFRSGTFGP